MTPNQKEGLYVLSALIVMGLTLTLFLPVANFIRARTEAKPARYEWVREHAFEHDAVAQMAFEATQDNFLSVYEYMQIRDLREKEIERLKQEDAREEFVELRKELSDKLHERVGR